MRREEFQIGQEVLWDQQQADGSKAELVRCRVIGFGGGVVRVMFSDRRDCKNRALGWALPKFLRAV